MHGSAANPKYDIVDTARSEASFKVFLHALQSAGSMVDQLKGAGPFTVFMPTDQAFDVLAAGTMENLLKPENLDRLKKFLKFHVVNGRYPSHEVESMQTLESANGDKLAVESDRRGIRINNAMVVGRDILCTNGIVHAIDSVLMGF